MSRAFHRARTTASVDHGSLKTSRSTVAPQLAEAGLHPIKTQAFLGHAHPTTTMTYYTAITNLDEAADHLPDLPRRSTVELDAPARAWRPATSRRQRAHLSFLSICGCAGDPPGDKMSHPDASERTMFPPEDSVLRQLEEFIESVPVAELRSPEGRSTRDPGEVYEVLGVVVEALSRGQAITIAPHDQTLTTQEAADLLGVSRPTLVKLLERGDIPHTQPGRHRRVKLADVLNLRQLSQEATERGLDEMVEIPEGADLYRDDVTSTRLRPQVAAWRLPSSSTHAPSSRTTCATRSCAWP